MRTVMLLSIVLLLLAGCAEEGNTIKIGVSSPQTGFAATMGEYVHRGLTLGQEYMPADVELIYEDEQCHPVEGFNVARKLVEIDEVHYVIGPFCTPVIAPTIDYYDERGVLRLVTGLGVDSTAYRAEKQFILLGTVEALMQPLAEHAYDAGLRRMAIVFMDNDYGKENADYFEKYFVGEVVIKETFVERGERDYRTQLLKIKNSDVDGILVASLGTHLVSSLKQLDEADLGIPIYSIRNTDDTEIVMAAGDLIEGVIFPSLVDLSVSEQKTWFVERYWEKYNAPPESVATNAFDSYVLLVSALSECGDDVACVQNEINSAAPYAGASGKFSIDAFGNGIRSPVIRTVKNGEFVVS